VQVICLFERSCWWLGGINVEERWLVEQGSHHPFWCREPINSVLDYVSPLASEGFDRTFR